MASDPSVKRHMAGVKLDGMSANELTALLNAILADLTTIRTQLNTHIHGGVTVGAGNTAAPTTTAPALTLIA